MEHEPGGLVHFTATYATLNRPSQRKAQRTQRTQSEATRIQWFSFAPFVSLSLCVGFEFFRGSKSDWPEFHLPY